MAPTRVRLSRARGWRKPPEAASVAYPTKWQNPHRNLRPRSEAVREYRDYLATRPDLVAAARRELAGRDLACWCPLDEPCHADVLLDVANDGT